MIRAAVLAGLLLSGTGTWTARAQDGGAAEVQAPQADPAAEALSAFDPLVGETWRGASITDPAVIDEITFERILDGRAIRSRHSVNGGAYAGETLIVFDADRRRLQTFYATNGGFYTTGDVGVRGPGAFDFDQVVHGLDGIERVTATTSFDDGVYRIRSRHLINGAWVDTGGFDYRPKP